MNASGLWAIVNLNIFGFAAITFAVLAWYFLFRRAGKTDPNLVAGISVFATIFAVAYIAIEHYFIAECPVSADRHRNNERILKENIKFLLSQPEEWRNAHAFSIADGTALDFVRKNNKLMPWDQDNDLLLQYDVSTDPEATALMGTLRKHYETIPDLHVKFHPERGLVQVAHHSGAHGDIWLWDKREVDGRMCLYNSDFTYGKMTPPNCIPFENVSPVKLEEWDLGGEVIQVPVMQNLGQFLASLFGPNYMTPYRNRWQCAENFVVHADRHWLLGYITVAAVLSMHVARTVLRYASAKRQGTVLPGLFYGDTAQPKIV
eukprot:TRINITY_DN16737_c0_g1_i1.p1 TRINITY_DN16737_c0_g1~~TRINITY_DN16737_c0_g1_i1.p1  ORF type:complete len:360 (+),score=96.82 TRINITY_DN16737_c0_g1_i1:128-1081(+)